MYYLIYETTNLTNGKLYRGAHQTMNINDGYLGSGKLITRAINKYGKEKFSRSILCYCDTIEDMIRKEAEYVDNEWVNDKTNYNLQTGGLSYGILNEESKQKISKTLKKKYANGEIVAPKGMLGKDSWNKGLTAREDSRIDSGTNPKKSKDPWNKGKSGSQVAWNKGLKTGPMDDTIKKQISKTLKKIYKTKEHHNKGFTPWNKGKTGSQVAWNKGLTAKKFICPYCSKEIGGASNFKRWHGDNCKLK